MTIPASALQPGDRIKRAGRTSHEMHGIVVTEIRETSLGLVAVYGTTRTKREPSLIFRGMLPTLPMVVDRE